MDDRIKNCRKYLEAQYTELKDMQGFQFQNDFSKSRLDPVWRSFSFGDAQEEKEIGGEIASEGGILFDPEIGIALILIPYRKSDGLAGQVNRALQLQSSFLPESNYAEIEHENQDERGTWRVVINWLLEENDLDDWLKEIKEIRRKTAHTEDIHLDSIVNRNADWHLTFESHGFPRLLLNVRKMLYQQSRAESTDWMSANKYVEEALRALPSIVETPEQKSIVTEVIKQIPRITQSKYGGENQDTSLNENSKIKLRNIRLQNFRNLENVMIDFGEDTVSSVVINGANGTGKSNLAEAVSFALFNCSKRYVDYLRDEDAASNNRPKHYFEEYIRPMGRPNSEISIVLNGKPLKIIPIEEVEEARSVLRHKIMNGIILNQEASGEFLRMSATELDVIVLRGYSELADGIQEYVNSQVNEANTVRQRLLREIGLNASIKRPDTAYEKVTVEQLSRSTATYPSTLVSWLESLSNTVDLPQYDQAGKLASEWYTWGSKQALTTLSSKLKGELRIDLVQPHLIYWLKEYNRLIEETDRFIAGITENIPSLQPHDAEEYVNQITIWGEWLSSQERKPSLDSSNELDRVRGEIAKIKAEQHDIEKKGRIRTERLSHFSNIDRFVKEHWVKELPDLCPTCGTNLDDRGGILEVISLLKVETEEERSEFRTEFKKLAEKINLHEIELAQMGQEVPPIEQELQSNLLAALQWLIPKDSVFSEYITNEKNRDNLIVQIRAFLTIPMTPKKGEPESESGRIAQTLIREFERIKRDFSGPENWGIVKATIDEQLSTIIAEHLPNTLEKLWAEISMNLTPAPWIHSESVVFNVTTQRGVRRTSVRLGREEGAPMARYILNHAEINVLGLSWFMMKYLTTGRFEMPLMWLDDPDQEMDQTTYRDLCRFLETLLRLHRVHSIPLTLLVALHQESRALDMTRATNANLYALDWGKTQSAESIQFLRLLGKGYHPAIPDINLIASPM